MKKIMLTAAALFALLPFSSALQAEVFSSMSIGGTTGLITTPTAQIGWDGNDVAVDIGSHYISTEGNKSYTPKVTASLFKRFEIGATYDVQKPDKNDNDLLAHAKFRFFPWNGSGKSFLAIGGNFQDIHIPNGTDNEYHDRFYQGYIAATYQGEFFSMPAETTLVIGKTYGDNTYADNSNIDYSMGFDLVLAPSVFMGYLHWINDFGNYSYSVNARGANAWYRGCFNTGARLAVLKGQPRLKLNIDILALDVLDDNREFGAGFTFGIAI